MRRNARMVCFAALTLLTSAAPTVAAAAPAAAVSEGARPLTPAEASRYRERESRTPALERFEGGRGETIAASTVIIILLVAILVVLVL